MSCKRVNCAQCLTVMVLKTQTRRVKQFLANLDKAHPFDPSVVVPFTSCRDSLDTPTTRTKTSNKWKNICSIIPTSHISPSTNYHLHSWIRITNWSIKCVRSTASSSMGRMWIHASSQYSSLRTASILSKCIMRSGECTLIRGWIGSRRRISARYWSRSRSYPPLPPQSIKINYRESSTNTMSTIRSQVPSTGHIRAWLTQTWDHQSGGGWQNITTKRRRICVGRASSHS